MVDLFLTNMQLFTSQDINWWTGVVWITCGLLWCFYQLFGLSFWRHPFTAEDPLVSKWCHATFFQICSDEEKTNLHLRLPEGEYILSKFSFLGELFFLKETFYLLWIIKEDKRWCLFSVFFIYIYIFGLYNESQCSSKYHLLCSTEKKDSFEWHVNE